MIRSVLIGAVAGARAMTPLAAVANAARNGELPADSGAPALLSHPLVSAATLALAVGELAGDKMKSAPDRIVIPGMAARLMTGAIAGAALAPRRDWLAGATLGTAAAVGMSYLSWWARLAAMRRFGQTRTGAVEDALVLASTVAIIRE